MWPRRPYGIIILISILVVGLSLEMITSCDTTGDKAGAGSNPVEHAIPVAAKRGEVANISSDDATGLMVAEVRRRTQHEYVAHATQFKWDHWEVLLQAHEAEGTPSG